MSTRATAQASDSIAGRADRSRKTRTYKTGAPTARAAAIALALTLLAPALARDARAQAPSSPGSPPIADSAHETAPATATNDPSRTLDTALSLYSKALIEPERGPRLAEFAQAERLFARLVANGFHTAALYTNLGNAALQAEHPGRAVLAYRRALLLDADAPRALQNLEHVRRSLPKWVPRPQPAGVIDTFFFWQRTVPRADRMLAAALCFALACAATAGAIRLQGGVLRVVAVLLGLGWVLLAGSVALDGASERDRDGIVTAGEAPARAADSALAPLALPDPLPGGTEVAMLERRTPWLRVRLANGRDAWVAESSVTPVDSFGD